MFAWLAGVFLLVVLLVIWSALFQRGLLGRMPEAAGKPLAMPAALVDDETATTLGALPANQSGGNRAHASL